MLVQFMVKNVLSFKEEAVLDMTAINAYKEHESNLIDCGMKDKFLRVAAIYGANASGKSNFYESMFFFQRIIVESFNNFDKDSVAAINKYYVPFKFEKELNNSEFQVIEMVGKYEYKYGFEYNSDCIVAEWLYRKDLDTKRTSIILERTTNKIEFGSSIRKECEVYREQIPKETLVLSFFNKLKMKTNIFNEVYSSIMDTFVASTDFDRIPGMLEIALPQVIDDKKDKEKLLQFLAAIDVGIKDVRYSDNEKEIRLFTIHKGKDGKEYELELSRESDGTIKCILLFICAMSAVKNDRSLFVDELNIKLHPLLMKFIVDLFYNNQSKAQLIYTTHDTTLMDKKYMRRDQIWFVQKDEFGYSELFALSDYRVRNDSSFEKDYLAGVYGGIPNLKMFEMGEGK